MPGPKQTFEEFKEGDLHSGSPTGPKVQNHKQAVAIALSEEAKEKGGAMPQPNRFRSITPSKPAAGKPFTSY